MSRWDKARGNVARDETESPSHRAGIPAGRGDLSFEILLASLSGGFLPDGNVRFWNYPPHALGDDFTVWK